MPPSRYGGGSSARSTSAPTVESRTVSGVVVEGPVGALCGRVDAVSARILVHHCVPAFISLGHDQDMILNFT